MPLLVDVISEINFQTIGLEGEQMPKGWISIGISQIFGAVGSQI